MERDEPTLRVAKPEDRAAVDALVKESAAAHFPGTYDGQAAESAVRYIAEVDPMLLEDGTYFVLEAAGEIVGCGGWSRRDRLYLAYGFQPLEDVEIPLPDGLSIAGVTMDKPIDP